MFTVGIWSKWPSVSAGDGSRTLNGNRKLNASIGNGVKHGGGGGGDSFVGGLDSFVLGLELGGGGIELGHGGIEPLAGPAVVDDGDDDDQDVDQRQEDHESVDVEHLDEVEVETFEERSTEEKKTIQDSWRQGRSEWSYSQDV